MERGLGPLERNSTWLRRPPGRKKEENSIMIDYSKIVIGVAPYTRGWCGVKNDGRDPKNPGLYATATPNSVKADDGVYSGTFSQTDLPRLISQYNLKEYYDETAEACYYYSESTGYHIILRLPLDPADYRSQLVRIAPELIERETTRNLKQ